MNTVQLDNGAINNYAAEPETYYATYPSPEQQRSYLVQGAIGFAVVAVSLLIALGVS